MAMGIIIPLLVISLLLLLFVYVYKIKITPAQEPVYKNKSGTIGRLTPTLEAKPEPISAMLGPIIALGDSIRLHVMKDSESTMGGKILLIL